MTRAIMKSMKFCLFNAALLAAMSGSAFAVDGVVLIDQNKALAGNVTPGDTAGFPVTITQPGSYRLAGNLIVPNSNTHAIVIAASHVTVDLNGFAILGPVDCSGGISPCAGAGSGSGITTAEPNAQFNITIRNGTIQGMGTFGIFLRGDSQMVEYMHVRSNGDNGIFIGASDDEGTSIVQHNTVQRNGGSGIALTNGRIAHNVISGNFNGIFITRGYVSNNVATRNANDGLLVGIFVGYSGNWLSDNWAHNVQGGINLGQNICGSGVCP